MASNICPALVLGSGEDEGEVTAQARAKNLPLEFRGRADHASDQMHDYKAGGQEGRPLEASSEHDSTSG